ncbi:MAG: Flp pilus assembly complex ATPase component TadA [Planctomycetes bacterium]|nr:Flp pilus assembly complex ATPase component TadA [Planctomycetota bacterium]
MATAVEPKPKEAALACVARDPRIAAALATVRREAFPPLRTGARELSPDALQRLLEDLHVAERSHVLIAGCESGYLPTLCGAIARLVTVVCDVPAVAGRLAEQLGSAGTTNIRLCSYVPGTTADDDGCDVVLDLRHQGGRLQPELQARLRPLARAAVVLDGAQPPRRLRRFLRLPDAGLAEDEIDLTRFLPLLGDLLVEAGAALRQEVTEAARAAAQNGRLLGEELLARGSVREDDLYRVLAQQRQLPFTQTAAALARLDRELVRQLPRKYLDHYRFLPLHSADGRVAVVTPNPDLPLWELASVFDGAEIVPELTTPTDLQRIWTAIELGFVSQPARPTETLPRAVDEAPVVVEDSRAAGLFDALLLDAVADRASDIHLESYETGARLRFRIDGSLHDVDRYRFSNDDVVALLNVVKIAANLDIAERRVPQSGRIRRRVARRLLDLRVQTQPTLYHETVVIRILPQDQRPPTVEDLGFLPDVAERYRRALRNPQGLVLVVGATGSGKSTTLYAGLQLLAQDPTRKVITIEDPIEYSMAGIQQTQVNGAVGFRFADAVRSFLRQDPDVILIGEIRDAETALEAIRAAQTGHLVLATLHCNDAVDAVQRLTDLGMHANSVASELNTVIAQRLARRLCTACRRPATPRAEVLGELFAGAPPADFRAFEGAGCGRCNGTGTRGRIAVVELLTVDAALRRAISRGAVLDDLRELAHRSGLRSLRDSALALVQEGAISLGELYDVLSAEQMRPVG